MISRSGIFKYNFVETHTGRIPGAMNVRADQVESGSAPEGAWTCTRELDDILEGGVEKGLGFKFPDQGASELSYGINVNSHAMNGQPYGSLDGHYIQQGDKPDHLVHCAKRVLDERCYFKSRFPNYVWNKEGGSGDEGAFYLEAANGFWFLPSYKKNERRYPSSRR